MLYLAFVLALAGVVGAAVATRWWLRRHRGTEPADTRRAAVIGVAGLLVSIASFGSGVAALATDKAPADDKPPGTVNNTGDGSTVLVCNNVKGSCSTALRELDELRDLPLGEALKELSKISDADREPSTNGPWPYIVLGTGAPGLVMRDGISPEDRALKGRPAAFEGKILYADCRVVDAWVADPSGPNTDALDTWLKVRWPEPADRAAVFTYNGYVFPVGHNGEIPLCE